MTIARVPFQLSSVEGDPIRGDVWVGGNQPGTAIVICHGFKGFKDWGFFPYTAEQLVERVGCPVVTFNFSGNGVGSDLSNFTELDKFERNTFSKELDDLKVVLDTAESGGLPQIGPQGRFGLLGHSRGGASAVITAAEDPRVAGVVTWNAVANLDRWPDEHKAKWRREGRVEIRNTRTGQMMPLGVELLEDYERNAERLDIQSAVARLSVPYLIIHGTDDQSVSVDDGQLLLDAGSSSLTRFERIEGTGHTFGAVHPFSGTTAHLEQTLQLTADWFAKALVINI